jgi:NAD(P)H-dependent FMN reductase
MKLLIVTQSSEHGINHRVALEAEAIAKYNTERRVKTKVLNVIDVTNKDLAEYDYQIWIVPEWNSSFPYTYKKMIDDSGHPSTLSNREILLIGTSETTFGNIVGITHLEHIIGWIGGYVFHKKVCLPNIGQKRNNDYLLDDRAMQAINSFIG